MPVEVEEEAAKTVCPTVSMLFRLGTDLGTHHHRLAVVAEQRRRGHLSGSSPIAEMMRAAVMTSTSSASLMASTPMARSMLSEMSPSISVLRRLASWPPAMGAQGGEECERHGAVGRLGLGGMIVGAGGCSHAGGSTERRRQPPRRGLGRSGRGGQPETGGGQMMEGRLSRKSIS